MSWRAAAQPDRSPRPLRECLERVTHSLGGAPPGVLSALFCRWEEIAGPALAAHTRPLSVSRGELVLAVDDPAWRAHLRYLEGDLLQRVGAVVGEGAVTSVRLVVRSS